MKRYHGGMPGRRGGFRKWIMGGGKAGMKKPAYGAQVLFSGIEESKTLLIHQALVPA